MKFFFTVILATALLLGGCAAPTPTPMATSTPTRTPTPTSSPTPTPGPSPTATSTPSTTADTTPPVISDIRILDISLNSMLIGWKTNEPATTQVEYGLTLEYGSMSPLYPDLVINHGVSLEGLLDLTNYHFRVRSKDAAGNEAISADKVQATYYHI